MKSVVDCKNYNLTNYCNKNRTTNAYFNEIRKYEVLSREKENELLLKAKRSNGVEQTQAIHDLINSNQRFVLSVALKYANDDNLLDLVSEGNIGLMEAIKRFDEVKDCKFITYAVWWIRKYVVEYLINKEKLTTPPNAVRLYGKVNKIKNKFIQREEREPTLSELRDKIFDETGFHVKDLCDLEDLVCLSFDVDTYSSDNHSLNIPYIENRTFYNNIDDHINENFDKEVVRELLLNLNEKERQIMCYSYGIGCEQLTNIQIGEKLNLSTERIRQLRVSILSKLSKLIDKDLKK